MTDHPLTEARAVELWNASLPATSWATAWILRPLGDRDRTHPLLAPLRTAYDAGREDALKPLDPLADLTPGTVIRDVTIVGLKGDGDAFILGDARGPYVATAHGFYSLPFLAAFTTDDRTTRYTRTVDGWTAETLKEDDA